LFDGVLLLVQIIDGWRLYLAQRRDARAQQEAADVPSENE